jgi:uridine kinase
MTLDETVALLVARCRELVASARRPVFVGLDGRSGAGKSTVAALVAARFASSEHDDDLVAVIDGDDFYRGGSAETWDRRSAVEKSDLVIDWHAQRAVLEELRERGVATWHPFDWNANDWDRDVVPVAEQPTRCEARPVVVLDGAYSCRPELHDLLDLRVLLDVPLDIRTGRLIEREGEHYQTDWEARWTEAEDHYFGTVMPPERFDLVLHSD